RAGETTPTPNPEDGTGVRTSLRLRWSPTFSSRLPNTVLKLLLMLGDRFPAHQISAVFRMRRVPDQITRPVQCPLRRRLPVEVPELGGGVHRVDRLSRAAGQCLQRPGQVDDRE